MLLQAFVGASPFLSSLILYTVGGTPWTGHEPVARSRPIHRINKVNIHVLGFEPTIPVFEWEKTVHALDRAVAVIGVILHSFICILNYITRLRINAKLL
jgi:hypothetical protein